MYYTYKFGFGKEIKQFFYGLRSLFFTLFFLMLFNRDRKTKGQG